MSERVSEAVFWAVVIFLAVDAFLQMFRFI